MLIKLSKFMLIKLQSLPPNRLVVTGFGGTKAWGGGGSRNMRAHGKLPVDKLNRVGFVETGWEAVDGTWRTDFAHASVMRR